MTREIQKIEHETSNLLTAREYDSADYCAARCKNMVELDKCGEGLKTIKKHQKANK